MRVLFGAVGGRALFCCCWYCKGMLEDIFGREIVSFDYSVVTYTFFLHGQNYVG